MIKRSPSRNHRSKGIKVKHVLQIILLLGVCFWLIYQVKHSHDKKKEFDENDSKLSVGTQTAYQTSKLGRKNLHPGTGKVNHNEKHEEEEEDENIVEDEDKHEHNGHEEEGNEHESAEKDDKQGVRGGGDEQEEDESKSDKMEDERGGGDDEIDENDQEQSVVDTDRDEFMDEEKEKEEGSDEKEKENNSKDKEKDGSVENHNSHEAREEHYKGDDASSAVTHDTGSETETLSLVNSDVNSEMNITKSGNRPNHTQKSNRNQHILNFNITEAELLAGTSSNATSDKETGSNSLSNAVDRSHLDNITTTYSDSHSEAGSNLTIVMPGGSNNLTGTSANISSEQNKMVIFSESDQAQNGTVNTTVTGDVKNVQTEGLEQGGTRVSEENLPGSNSTVPVETEKGDAAAGESSNLEGGELEKTRRFEASNETENNSFTETSETNRTQNISYMKENTDATKDEFKGDTETDKTSNTTSAIGTSNSVEHHHTDSSDSHILKNVAVVRTALDTLPDIRNEGDNGDATATD
ncbi:dentin sialophosphoprotein [Spatholobus suberectus]|nr:dentin sialophosphoprotein [Spatholobus suberectus]